MADVAQLERALRNADAAGDADAARVFAAEIQRMRQPSPPSAQGPKPWSDVAAEAMLHAGPSAVNFARDTFNAIRHPAQTFETMQAVAQMMGQQQPGGQPQGRGGPRAGAQPRPSRQQGPPGMIPRDQVGPQSGQPPALRMRGA